MRITLLTAMSVLAFAACSKPADKPAAEAEHTIAAAPVPATATPDAAAGHEMAGHDMSTMASTDLGGGMMMTPPDPGGFTAEGFTFHTRPGTKHIVRLEAPGTDTWKPASDGAPTVKALGVRTETTPDGKKAMILEYEMLQSGNAAIKFERMEDGKVEGSRTINFMVH